MEDLLSMASELVENNNYKNVNNFEEKKPDGEYEVLLESISLKESEQTGTEWFNIVAKVLSGEYAEEKFYIKLFLTEKTTKTTLSKIMTLIDAAGYTIDPGMFSDTGSIVEGLQSLIGSTIILVKKTSGKGYINYSFEGSDYLQ